MPALFTPHSTGIAGFSSTRSIIFLVGTARLLALEFRENVLCVFNSLKIKRGKRTSSVVKRIPAGLIESASTRALKPWSSMVRL